MTTTTQSTDATNTTLDAAMQMGTEEKANTDVNGTDTMKSYIRPDRYFSAEQIQRLQFLMRRSQEAAHKDGPPLTSKEETERDALIEAELLASAQRAGALADALGR